MARSNGIQRLVDFCIGVPVVIVLGIFRKRSALPSRLNRVGVICPTAIGDLILASGLLVRLQERFPKAEIHVFHGKSNVGALPLLPVDVVGHECDFRRIYAVVRKLKAAKLDIAIDITPWPRITAIAACLSGAPSIGYQTKGQFRHFAFDVAVRHMVTRHEMENLAAIADLFGSGFEYRASVRDLSAAFDIGVEWENCILCHPCPGGARANEKRWPNERWIDLVQRLTSKGMDVVFTGSRSDRSVVEKILAEVKHGGAAVHSLCGEISLEEMCYALRKCRLFVTVDTGVMHIASLMGIPMVALVGPTDFRRWGARSRSCVSVRSGHPRAGYISLGFERCADAEEIMSEIGVDDVFSAVTDQLERFESRSVCV